MAIRQRFVAGQLFTLYQLGAIGDLTDGQLLERFTAGDGEPAELAFAALVERHGPMVLRLCSTWLRDPHDAQDAFQATFLVLLRKARGLWIHDSLGPWLHRVARRVADRVQVSARRRREYERKAAESRTMLSFDRCGPDEPWIVLHEEIDRLPERYRVPVVLCHLEGQSHVLAAKTLRLPVGTVKSRLHRARDLLRGRLSRRGVAFSAGLLTVETASRAADAAFSLPLLESFIRAVARSGMDRAGRGGLISARTVYLVEEVIKTMFVTKMRIGVAVALLAASLAAGAAGVFAQQGPGSAGGQAAPKRGGTSVRQKAQQAATGRESAPPYISASRKMIIERLEQELHAAEKRLDLTTERVDPSDPEAVRARKTVETLAGLMARIDTVLVEAVDEFPTIFDFSARHADRGAPADRSAKAGTPEDRGAPADRSAKATATLPTYDEHSLAHAAERMDWSKRMHEKGYVSKAQHDVDVHAYEALLAVIEGDIARGQDRVDWAKQMFKKGYITKQRYDEEILKHYDALKARLGGKEAVNDAVLERYELLKRQLREHPADPRAESKPGSTSPEKKWDEYMEDLVKAAVQSGGDGGKHGGAAAKSADDPGKPGSPAAKSGGDAGKPGSPAAKPGDDSGRAE